ncbi:hypothetical protein BHE74_00048278 [Ensete ventricosum]|nr:hypothetical protein GW17_00015577 [Ensete ventricosum]RWW45847.1 hypothetical protein BHE74_00048278 [Ensete ventricosum]RZS11812.1 hypothetical protein BHM03_00043179 [Ensete ventricosum]
MARILSRALIRTSQTPVRDPCSSLHHLLLSGSRSPTLSFLPRLLSFRGRSDRSAKAEIVEIDLGTEREVDVVRHLDDAIHAILVRKSAPDWLPFIPGSSYWVPPRRRAPGLLELVAKLANPLTGEEAMSFTTIRGWPSSSYFVEGKLIRIDLLVCECFDE